MNKQKCTHLDKTSECAECGAGFLLVPIECTLHNAIEYGMCTCGWSNLPKEEVGKREPIDEWYEDMSAVDTPEEVGEKCCCGNSKYFDSGHDVKCPNYPPPLEVKEGFKDIEWEKEFDLLTPDQYELGLEYEDAKKWLNKNPHLFTGNLYDEPMFTLDKDKIKEYIKSLLSQQEAKIKRELVEKIEEVKKEILHKLAHYFCINKAIETTEVIGGVKYPAFRCIKCGKVD